MCWLVYTERNLTEFISSYDRDQEVVIVNPLFAYLQKNLELNKLKTDEVEFGDITVRQFNKNYLSKNSPVIIRGMATDWPAS